ncbi:MAG: radical SAM protein [Candidatus Omnitrophica bacterium]|nr:radical SAM protein [Candidatus Omnitrophota bacterium]
MQGAIEDNIRLNQEEFDAARGTLSSTPEGIGIGAHYRCNGQCVFCLGGKEDFFSLRRYQEFFEPKLGEAIRHARYVNFCGFGELLFLPEIEEFLSYVNATIPQVNKIYTTNGTPLANRAVVRLLTESKSVVEISLHASTAALHQRITGLRNFDAIQASIKDLIARRVTYGYPTVSLVFLIHTLNIEDLPDFVTYAASLGVDEVIANYLTIFKKEHIPFSCFFEQDKTVFSMAEAESRARSLGMAFRMPPRFQERAGLQEKTRCSDPWKYCYIENEGRVYPCCYAGESVGQLEDTAFTDIWNGQGYQELRRSWMEGPVHEWCRYCMRYAKDNVNDLCAHINARPGFREEIIRNLSK